MNDCWCEGVKDFTCLNCVHSLKWDSLSWEDQNSLKRLRELAESGKLTKRSARELMSLMVWSAENGLHSGMVP
jgi:hypothetical protein